MGNFFNKGIKIMQPSVRVRMYSSSKWAKNESIWVANGFFINFFGRFYRTQTDYIGI